MPSLNTVAGPPPLVVEFIEGTSTYREPSYRTGLPIVGNGPPGTFVQFADGRRVPLPTDQVVLAQTEAGSAHVGFGGMRFDGVEAGQLVFRRVRDLWPEDQLSPERGRKMTLALDMVAFVRVDGQVAWPIQN